VGAEILEDISKPTASHWQPAPAGSTACKASYLCLAFHISQPVLLDFLSQFATLPLPKSPWCGPLYLACTSDSSYVDPLAGQLVVLPV